MHKVLKKVVALLFVCVAVLGGAAVLAPSVWGYSAAQTDRRDESRPGSHLKMLAGSGSRIGVSISDVDASAATSGVVIDAVRDESPAERAGFKEGDTLVEFDGERVRSARQFSRLVQETTPGRTVKAAVMRENQRVELSVTPEALRAPAIEDHVSEALRGLDGLRDLDFGPISGYGRAGTGRLGVTVQDLSEQLANYFGVKAGVLVTSVSDNTPASRAGLRAGDIVTTIGNEAIDSAADLRRELAKAEKEVSIGLVRDKKELTLKATLEPPARRSITRRGV